MSGRKNNLLKFKTMSAGDMSQASLISLITNIQWLDNIGIQFNFTGSPTGDFHVEVSADYAQDNQGNVTNAGLWVPITLSPAPTASGSAGQIYINITEISAPWIRQTYNSTLIETADIQTVLDVSGSLNSTYWLLDGADGDNWYVWYDNGSGVDPAIANRTGIQVTYMDNDSANTIASATKTALAACTSIDTIGGSTNHVTFAQTIAGAGSIADGADATSFTFGYVGASGSLDIYITGKMI